jgi:hypothetical protein
MATSSLTTPDFDLKLSLALLLTRLIYLDLRSITKSPIVSDCFARNLEGDIVHIIVFHALDTNSDSKPNKARLLSLIGYHFSNRVKRAGSHWLKG